MRRFLTLLATCVLAACARSKEAPPTAPVLEASASSATTPAAILDASTGAAPDAAVDAGSAFDEETYRTADPTFGKSIGPTSVVFKVRLKGGIDAVFKPRSRR